jgi:hypothetical protein
MLFQSKIRSMCACGTRSFRRPFAASTLVRKSAASNRHGGEHPDQRIWWAVAEELEGLLLLSSQPLGFSPPLIQSDDAGATSIPGYTPAQIRHAYGIDAISLPSSSGPVAGDGTGQTIAIVAAFDDPEFVDSSSPGFANSDLHQFDLQFGLADPPSFTNINSTVSVT